MISVLLSLIAVFLILVFGEYLWRSKKLKGELGRKFIHITVGTFVAFWPFYMSFRWVQIVSLAFLAVVLVSKYFNIFRSVHTIERKTWGDVMFAIGIGLTAILTGSKWIFLAAILHLSLADGFAAIVGKKYGKNNQYKVFGFTKSFIGSATFWFISVLILLAVFVYGTPGLWSTMSLLIWLPVAATIVENLGVYGIDNIFIPLLIVVVLSQLQVVV